MSKPRIRAIMHSSFAVSAFQRPFALFERQHANLRKSAPRLSTLQSWRIVAFCSVLNRIQSEFSLIESSTQTQDVSDFSPQDSIIDMAKEHLRSLWINSSIRECLPVYLRVQFRSYIAESEPSPQITPIQVACQSLRHLGLGVFLDLACSELVLGELRDWIHAKFKGMFEDMALPMCIDFAEQKLLPWLESVGVSGRDAWRARLLYHVHETLGALRISEMFEIIIDVAESEAALKDLRICMNKTGSQSRLVSDFTKSIKRRLLHPGAQTNDILEQYMSCIKGLRILDPTGLLLEKVTRETRAYLRGREDTIRCILSRIVDDPSGADMMMEDAPEPVDDENWVPLSKDIDADKVQEGDLFTRLMTIYDSRTVFVKEYQSMLASKLLTATDYNIDKETENFELLKLKFGESNLQSCDVMLRDVLQSQRFDRTVKHTSDDIPIHATVISSLFWPQVRGGESIELPESVSSSMKNYAEQWIVTKPSRRLEWLPHLGGVTLELEFGETPIEFTVSPLLASIIMQFDEKESVSLSELSESLKMSPGNLRKRVRFWVNAGILAESLGQDDDDAEYRVVEAHERDAAGFGTIAMDHDEDSFSNGHGVNGPNFDEYWTFVHSMLQNRGPQTIESIQSSLELFFSDEYEGTVEQLRGYLGGLVGNGTVEMEGTAVYKLPGQS